MQAVFEELVTFVVVTGNHTRRVKQLIQISPYDSSVHSTTTVL